MNIFDTIAALVQGQNPDQAVMSGAQLPPPGPPPQASAAPPQAPPQAGAPQGIPTPFTDPRPANQTPTVTQSPPDLANMYLELMRKNQNAQQLDSGLTLIAAGLTRNQGAREALIQQAGKGGGNTTGMTAADFVNMQKIQQAQQQQLLFNSAKQGLMKKYNLSDADMAAMTPDTANEIIKHHATQNLVHVQSADGSSAFYNATNGQKMADISGPKADDTEVVNDPNTGKQQLINKRTGQVIREIVGETKPVDTEVINDPNTGKQVLINKRTGQPIRELVGETKPTATEIVKNDTTGEQNLIEKETGKVIQQLVPARKPGEAISEDTDKLFQINKDRLAAKQPPLTMEDYLKNVKKGGVNVNVGDNGAKYPAPKEGWDYVRNPDGTVKIGDNGQPTQYEIKGGPAAEKTDIAQKAEVAQETHQIVTNSAVGKAIDNALPMVDQLGVAGTLGKISRSPPFNWVGGKPSDDFDAQKARIQALFTTQTLQEMRAQSKTGASGLGQVSDFENRMLANTKAALDERQSPSQLKDELFRAKAVMAVLAANSFKEGDQAKFDDLVDSVVNKYKAEAAKSRGITVEQATRVK